MWCSPGLCTGMSALLQSHLLSLELHKVHLIIPVSSTASFPKAPSSHWAWPNTMQTMNCDGTNTPSSFLPCLLHQASPQGCQRTASSSRKQLLAATWPATNALSHQRAIWRQKHFWDELSISSVTHLKSFLLLPALFQCQNKTSLLSLAAGGYLGKMTPGWATKGCSLSAPSLFIYDLLQTKPQTWLWVFVEAYLEP